MKSAIRVVSTVLLLSVLASGARAETKKAGAGRATAGGKRVVKVGGDSRAWTTLRPLLPQNIALAGQVNVSALRSSDTFKQLRRLLEKDGDTRDLLAAARSGCQLDVIESIQDVAFAVTQGDDNKVLLAVSFKGVGEAELVSCAEAAVNKQRGGAGAAKKIESHKSGNIVEYAVSGEGEHIYAAWLAPDVVAFASDPTQREPLAALIGGKGGFAGAPATRRAFAALAPGAPAWAVYVEPEHIDSYDLKLAAASLNVSGGQLQVDVSLFLADADSAKRAAADWTAQRDQLAGGSGGVPPIVGQLVKTVQIAATDDVVRVTASIAEKDFLAFFSLF